MPFSVSYDEINRITSVHISGSITYQEHCAARDEAVKICRENNCTRIIVDLSGLITARGSAVDCFTFGKSLSKHAPGIRIAHITPRDPKSYKDVLFTSTVEKNRGVNTRDFNSREEAMKWLLG